MTKTGVATKRPLVPKYEEVLFLYPRGRMTGGPLAIHQVAELINELGGVAKLVPAESSPDDVAAAEFQHFKLEADAQLVDRKNCLVVAPEVNFKPLFGLKQSQRAVWWLSWDNAKLARAYFGKSRLERLLLSIRSSKGRKRLKAFRHDIKLLRRHSRSATNPVRHFSQSVYSDTAVKKFLHLDTAPLSDYTWEEKSDRTPAITKSQQVVVNAKRGSAELAMELVSQRPSIKWVFLEKMSHEDLMAEIRKSCLLIDLGTFPGKDRIPREAISLGTPVLLANRGSASYQADFPVPLEFKIDLVTGWQRRALSVVDQALADPGGALQQQQAFLRNVETERDVLVREITDLFFK